MRTPRLNVDYEELMRRRLLCTVLALFASAGSARAQQRPLVTEDPEPIGAGRVLLEGGLDLAHDQQYPVSGLKGNLLRVPTIGISVGVSSIAEVQIDGGFYDRLNITDRNLKAPGLRGDGGRRQHARQHGRAQRGCDPSPPHVKRKRRRRRKLARR